MEIRIEKHSSSFVCEVFKFHITKDGRICLDLYEYKTRPTKRHKFRVERFFDPTNPDSSELTKLETIEIENKKYKIGLKHGLDWTK